MATVLTNSNRTVKNLHILKFFYHRRIKCYHKIFIVVKCTRLQFAKNSNLKTAEDIIYIGYYIFIFPWYSSDPWGK